MLSKTYLQLGSLAMHVNDEKAVLDSMNSAALVRICALCDRCKKLFRAQCSGITDLGCQAQTMYHVCLYAMEMIVDKFC